MEIAARALERFHSLCHPPVAVKALSCQEEAACEHYPEHCCHLWVKARLKGTEAKSKAVL